ncbi:hypothetical protein [Pseudonocardia sp. Ae707_Ps1]|uniref:hypothetical protein n=1 Tax=Pseudonocardia sp. Ae707_Ps1 TaxID=1885572 RepID=UPI00094AF119|nr:hypothetical protein [Pseudonocardia sp. Ae707_Ps1]
MPPPAPPRDTLLPAILGPDLPEAACTGRWELFDPPHAGEPPDDLDYRRHRARTICQRCPALTACELTADDFAAQRGSHGFVLAGRTVAGKHW